MSLITEIVSIEWKEARRSPALHRKLLVNIFIFLSFCYLAVNGLVLGFLLDDLLMHLPAQEFSYRQHGSAWVVRILNQYLLFFFLADFAMRYSVQRLPVMSVMPMLHLPIKRSWLSHYILLKSLINPWFLLYAILFGPFVSEMFSNLNFSEAFGWTLGVTSTAFLVHWAVILLKRKAQSDYRITLASLLTLAALLGIQWFDVLDIRGYSSMIFDGFVFTHWAGPLAAGLSVLLYAVNHRTLGGIMYQGSIGPSEGASVTYTGPGLLHRFGIPGVLCAIELKLLWRNKRTRSLLWMSVLFLAYGLLIFPQAEVRDVVVLNVLMALFMTGMFIINYGQFLLSWEGAYFDHVLTRNVSFRNYYKSKLLLFSLFTMAATILCIPYVYFGTEILLAIVCVSAFNLGVSSFVVMFFGSLNPKKINLDQHTSMNWQGIGAAQFLLILPILGFPMLLTGVASIWMSRLEVMLMLGLIGVLSLAASPLWFRLLAGWLHANRHEIAEDFRKD